MWGAMAVLLAPVSGTAAWRDPLAMAVLVAMEDLVMKALAGAMWVDPWAMGADPWVTEVDCVVLEACIIMEGCMVQALAMAIAALFLTVGTIGTDVGAVGRAKPNRKIHRTRNSQGIRRKIQIRD